MTMSKDEIFEALMTRPSFYFNTSEERQWEIDDDLGILDVPCIALADLTPEQKARYNKHFGKRIK